MIIFENIGVGWGLAPTFYFADFSPYFKWGQSFVMPSLLCVGMLFLLAAAGQNGGSYADAVAYAHALHTIACTKLRLTRKSFVHVNNYEL